ncbi:MAG: hypothetical protein SFY66_06740 [Oculatellaceae cyanobacterium bins.114]|nr:hypothetical protein [Oculatellaceae cyanobacterium bins.114]
MSKQDYQWKRFWCPRSGNINLADGGYLSDPDAELGKTYNPDLVSLEAIADVPCLVLLGEAGMGKTTAIEAAHKQVCEQTKNLEDVCLPLFRLGDYGSDTDLCTAIFRSNAFQEWLSGTHKLYLFLDSLDEGLLSIKILVRILKREINNLPCDRLYFRLTCRTAEWASSLEEKLIEKWGKDSVRVYTLAPLRRQDVIEAASKSNIIDVDHFLRAISDRNAVPLAIKPITLQFLIDIYIEEGKLPSSQIELYKKGCLQLCEELNSDRREAGEKGKLSSKKRILIAGRIAAVMIFCRRSAVWTSPEHGKANGSDISIQDLCIGQEQADNQAFDLEEDYIREVFKVTGLFSDQECNQRIDFSHRTYAEFLASWYLKQHNIPLEKITKLLFSSEDPDHKLIPQLHETAAWLASMRLDVLQEIIKTDPDVLLQTDVPTDPEIRSSIVDNLLTQYEEGKLFDRDRNNYRYYAKLKHPGLVEQLRPYICNSNKQEDARDLAIDIAEVCEVSELQDELAQLTLDSTQSIYLRVSAAKAICSVGDASTRLKLKPLAIEQLPEDEDDELKGYALQALWSDCLTAEELFQNLTPPKRRKFFGGYRFFLNYKIVPQLQSHDLIVALNWLNPQGVRCFGHPFEELGDAILLKAWENFDLPGVAEHFTQVALVQWREHQRIITHDSKLQEQFASSLLHDSRKRHTLIEQAVLSVLRTEEDSDFLLSSLTEKILVSEDIFWLLEKLQTSNREKVQKFWAQLIQWNFNRQDIKQIDAVIVAAQTNGILQEIFAPYFTPIELDSAKANKLKADYLKIQEMQNCRQNPPLLDPLPKERVLQLLEKLEAGDLSAWWQLNMEMVLKPRSQRYDNEFELDLTQLPGWQEADEATQERIIEGAKRYIQQQDHIGYDWIRTNTFNRAALAGCRALQLLLKKSCDFLENLPSEKWKIWAPVVVAASNSNQHKASYLKLVRCIYLNAPEESIRTLIELIDKENQQHSHISVINRFERCWDKKLNLVLLEKVKSSELKPNCVGQLLETLLKKESSEAKDFTKSLISYPLPLVDSERKKVLIAFRLLLENSDPCSWSLIWSLIQEDTSFGREVLESASYRYSHWIQLNLTEKQLADLYVWLVHQYPYEEDLDHSNEVLAYDVTARDCIARMRDSVLSQLKQKGTLQACTEIQRLIQELPNLVWLGRTLIDAQANMRRKTWQPQTPEEFLQFVLNKDKRLVQNGQHLLEVLIESLEHLELEIQGETPAVRDLWDKSGKNSFRPLDENAFSDYVKRFLDRDLKSRGIIVNREVELRRSYGGNSGERTDIHVDAVLKHPNGEAYDSITAIIEIKGCWHSEVQTAMQTQLVERYLADNACPYGLYLVGWFTCQQWDNNDSRRNQVPRMTLPEARTQFNNQAEELSSSGNVVRAYVLNTALR